MILSSFTFQDGRVLMWDRRKPNKPATRIGEEGRRIIAASYHLHVILRSLEVSDPFGIVS